MAAVSVIGYPDYFTPRDWLAGLEGVQVAATVPLTAPTGAHTLYTVPAGRTLVVRILQNAVAGKADPATPVSGTVRCLVEAEKGFDGASTPLYLSWAEAIMAPGAGGGDNVVLQVPLVLKGGAAGNALTCNQAVTNMVAWDGQTILAGVLL